MRGLPLVLGVFLLQLESLPLHRQLGLDSLQKVFVQRLEDIPSPEFDALHTALFQKGHAAILYDVLEQDSLSGLVAFIRMKLHKAFSIPRTMLVQVIPNPNLEIRTPVVFTFSTGLLVFEYHQIKIYKHAPDTIPTNPWAKDGMHR
jgi:hypothetical protein